MRHTLQLFLTAVGLAFCVMTSAQPMGSITYTVGGLQVTLTDLGVLPTGTASAALAINNRSEIAGSANRIGADNNWEFVLPIWDANTGAVVGMAETSGAALPRHRNDNGEMVGTDCVGTCGRMFYGYYWSPAGLIFRLPPLAGTDPFYSSTHTMANGINNAGQIVGLAKQGAPTFDTYAALWQDKDTLAQPLGSLGRSIYGMISSVAYGINNLTHVVGNSTIASDSAIRAFLWRDGRMIDLGALSGQLVSEAYALNNNGLIVGKSNLYPVTWNYDVANATSTPAIRQLPVPSGFFTAQPTAVNDSGDVAGYAGSPNIDAHAILWRNGQAVDLGIWPGGHYSVASGINNLGRIVGTGTVAGDNLDHALMWTVAGAGGGTTMRSTAITLSATLRNGVVTVTGTVKVKDQTGSSVAGAATAVTWTLPGGATQSQTATTGSGGSASFSATGGRGKYTLTITNITKSGYTFDRANSVLSKSITK